MDCTRRLWAMSNMFQVNGVEFPRRREGGGISSHLTLPYLTMRDKKKKTRNKCPDRIPARLCTCLALMLILLAPLARSKNIHPRQRAHTRTHAYRCMNPANERGGKKHSLAFPVQVLLGLHVADAPVGIHVPHAAEVAASGGRNGKDGRMERAGQRGVGGVRSGGRGIVIARRSPSRT